jgi:putative transposase
MLLYMEHTFEHRMRPNTTQEAALFAVLKASRQLYNDALAEWKAHFEATGQYLSLYEQGKHHHKTTYPDVPAVVMDQVMQCLHRALTAYFKGCKEGRAVGFPRYKPPQRWHSIEFRQGLAGRHVEAVPPH